MQKRWGICFSCFIAPLLGRFGLESEGTLRCLGLPPSDLSTLFGAWKGKDFSTSGNIIWRLVLGVVYWSIWFERNKRVFEGHAEPSLQVYKRAKDRILFWAPQCKDCGLLLAGDLSRNCIDVIGRSSL